MAEDSIRGVLSRIRLSGQAYRSVPDEDGRALRVFAEVARAKSVVEIGTSTGVSGLWFCIALERTGGHLITFELDHGRAEQARLHFREAGVESLVTIVEGDAHLRIQEIVEPIDLIFIDGDKEGYVDYLHWLLPRVRIGGLILAHNINIVQDYVSAVKSEETLETIFYTEGRGMAVSLRKSSEGPRAVAMDAGCL